MMYLYRKLVLRLAILAALLVSLYGTVNASSGCEKCIDLGTKCISNQCPNLKFPPPEGCAQFCSNEVNRCLTACEAS